MYPWSKMWLSLALMFAILLDGKQPKALAAQNSMKFALIIVTKPRKNAKKLIINLQKTAQLLQRSAPKLAVTAKKIVKTKKKQREIKTTERLKIIHDASRSFKEVMHPWEFL